MGLACRERHSGYGTFSTSSCPPPPRLSCRAAEDARPPESQATRADRSQANRRSLLRNTNHRRPRRRGERRLGSADCGGLFPRSDVIHRIARDHHQRLRTYDDFRRAIFENGKLAQLIDIADRAVRIGRKRVVALLEPNFDDNAEYLFRIRRAPVRRKPSVRQQPDSALLIRVGSDGAYRLMIRFAVQRPLPSGRNREIFWRKQFRPAAEKKFVDVVERPVMKQPIAKQRRRFFFIRRIGGRLLLERIE
jgi:hypothetical protein